MSDTEMDTGTGLAALLIAPVFMGPGQAHARLPG